MPKFSRDAFYQMEKIHKFDAILQNHTNDAWGFHIVVPKKIADAVIDGKSRRAVCVLNGEIEFQCGLMSNGRGELAVMINKTNRQKLGIEKGSPLKVEIRRDTSKYGLPMPEEFAEVLRQDDEGNELFHRLTAGRQRSLLYQVGAVKDTDKRIHRALIILEHLKNNNGKVNGEQLLESLKRPLI